MSVLLRRWRWGGIEAILGGMIPIPFSAAAQPWVLWVIASVAVLIIGVAKSGFGGGVGIIAVPLFVVAFGAKLGNGVLLPILILADVFSVWNHWKTWDVKLLKILAPGTMVGVVLGSGLLWWLIHLDAKSTGADWLGRTTGVVCVLYVLADLLRQKYASGWNFKPAPRSGLIAGTGIGVVSTLAHAAGPIAAIFLLGAHVSRQTFLGTVVIYFLVLNSVKLVPYAALGQINTQVMVYSLWFVPLVPVGTWLGAKLSRRFSERGFRTTILVITFLTGLMLAFNIDPAQWFMGNAN